MGDDYRDTFYAAYARTHTIPEKGRLDQARLHSKARVWERHFARLLPADRAARILDAGCGDGALLWWLQREGYSAEGVEVSAEQAGIASALGIERVTVASIEDFLSDHGDRYDVVILRNVMEHFPKVDLLRLIELVRGSLRPGGRLIAQVPNGQAPMVGRIRYGDFTHEMAFTERSLNQLFAIMGFEGIACHPVPPVFGGATGWARASAWRLVEFIYRCLIGAEVSEWPRVVTLDIIVTADRPQ